MSNAFASPRYLALLREFEGFFAEPYLCPAGRVTIGYGTNLEAHPRFIPGGNPAGLSGRRLLAALRARGLRWSREEACAAMLEELAQTHADLVKRCSAYRTLRERGETVRAEALLDMAYNMGVGAPRGANGKGSGLLGFCATLPMIEAGDYRRAACNLVKSLWYRQVGRRARAVVSAMREGAWPEKLV